MPGCAADAAGTGPALTFGALADAGPPRPATGSKAGSDSEPRWLPESADSRPFR